MAAPEYVPIKPMDDVRTYESPPRRPQPWRAVRPGDLHGGQPHGPWLGNPGPDQGFALTIAHRFEGKLHLTKGEHERDAIVGCTGVALKRAALFGRAPVIHDLTVAFTVWGFLTEQAPADLVAIRKPLFEEVAHPEHYAEQRQIVDMVPDATLRMTPPAQVADAFRSDWRSLLLLEA
ncbi:MAG: hypothetical protein QOF97_10 [Acidimicrobiaceae bacterium]